ncbi:hypothetical protein LSH36_899g00035, partial [Paralvinella palmiformis]
MAVQKCCRSFHFLGSTDHKYTKG